MSNKSAFEISKGFAPDTIRSRDNYRRDGHGFQTGDVVYFSAATSEWEKSDWIYDNITGTSEALGVVDVKDAYRFDVVYRGSVLIPDSLAVTGPSETIQQNTVYFLSDTPGVLTETPPEIDVENPKVRKPILVTLNSDGAGNINAIVVNYRGYVEDTNGCVAFVQNIIPVGTIEFIPSGQKSPTEWKDEGWLLCDGSEYFITEYPELFDVVGYAYGTSTATDRFRVPDMWNILPNQRVALAQQASTVCAVADIPLCGGNACSACFEGLCSAGQGNLKCCNKFLKVWGTRDSVVQKINNLAGAICGSFSMSFGKIDGINCDCDTGEQEWQCETPPFIDPPVISTIPGPNPCGLTASGQTPFIFPNGCLAASGMGVDHPVLRGSCDGCTDAAGAGGTFEDYLRFCDCCACPPADAWGCAGGIVPSPDVSPAASPEASPVASPPPTPPASPEASPVASPPASPPPTPPASPAVSASPVASPPVTPTRSPTPTATPTPGVSRTPTPTPTPSPTSTPRIEPGRGRILIAKNAGVLNPQDAYAGDDDIEIVVDEGGIIAAGSGYAASSPFKNKQAAYHGNFYIRAISVERYVNIKNCNGGGGAVKNWIPNGALNVWQRGTSFAPDVTKIESDHLADLNRYTADRWFRKVGFCPQGYGATGNGASSHSSYIGVCNRKSFGNIDSSIPESLRKQYPTHFMEYQSYISGPGVDTSLEYCVLENRISDVKTLAGDTVCVSFWARSDTPGSFFVNLKQHFGYDVPPSSPLTVKASTGSLPFVDVAPRRKSNEAKYSYTDTTYFAEEAGVSGTLLIGKGYPNSIDGAFYLETETPSEHESGTSFKHSADSSSQGGVNAVYDGTILLPDAKQVQQILLQAVNTIDSPDVGIIQVSPPPNKYGITVEATLPEQQVSAVSNIFFKNTNNQTNIKAEGRGAEAPSIVNNESDSVNTEQRTSLAVAITFTCVPNPICTQCVPYVSSIIALNTLIYTNEQVDPCIATLQGNGAFAVSAGQSSTQYTTSIPLSIADYLLVQNFTIGQNGFPPSVVSQAVAAANALAQSNTNACRCAEQTNPTNIAFGAPGSCLGDMTKPKNYDAIETLGICCTVTVGSVEVGQSGALYVTHTREENHTAHSCTALGGQFISYSALDYFAQFESTACGVTEDQCSEYVKIDVTTAWQQYEIVFSIPIVDGRYIGNSGTDYLALQVWTHLSNGYCRTYSGAEAPPRNRLGESFGTIECSENSLCETCVSIFPTPFSYQGKLNLTQFQMQTGTEFTGFVQPDSIEEVDSCQAFYESSTCVGRRDYYPVGGSDFFEYQVQMKKQKSCKTPRPVITGFTPAPFGINNIDILADTVTQKSFVVGGDVWVNNGAGSVVLSYECDCDVYRPEELQYLAKQLEWKALGS